MIGTVSRYRIVSKLGGGGMGVVCEAEDLELQRRVAIRFLPEERTKTPAALEHFKREARAASALNHPHICTVYDVGSHEAKGDVDVKMDPEGRHPPADRVWRRQRVRRDQRRVLHALGGSRHDPDGCSR